MAGVLIEDSDLDKLKTLGVKDSKLLTQNKREELYKEIIKIVKDYKIIKIYPEEIDNALFSDTSNLNNLEGEKMAEIINYLRPEKVIVDCPSTNKKAFTEFLNKRMKVKTEILCEWKADFLFPEVSAASILAKCAREEEVELIKKQIADPGLEMKVKVRDFMKFNIFNYYDFVLDQKRAEDETYARFSKALTDIVNELPNIDPAFDRFLEGRNGNVEMDLLELNKILQPYFETLGYVCMITPDLEEGIKRPNMILMETSDIKTFEVNCLNQTHVMKYRDVIGVAIPLIQGYKTPGNETEGMVIGEKDKDTICLIDTVRVKRIAESAWDTMQDGTNEYAPLLRRIFPTISKEGFIMAEAANKI